MSLGFFCCLVVLTKAVVTPFSDKLTYVLWQFRKKGLSYQRSIVTLYLDIALKWKVFMPKPNRSHMLKQHYTSVPVESAKTSLMLHNCTNNVILHTLMGLLFLILKLMKMEHLRFQNLAEIGSLKTKAKFFNMLHWFFFPFLFIYFPFYPFCTVSPLSIYYSY